MTGRTYKLTVATVAAALIAAGASVASGETGTASGQGPGCQGPRLTGAATPQLVLHTPQALTVTETLTDTCPGLRLAHTVLYLTGPQGWTVTPAGAQPVADLQPGGHDTLTWQVQVPAGASGGGLKAQAIYDVGPHSTDSTVGSVTAAVAFPSQAAALDNVGVTNDSDTGPGDIDGSGYSFSAQALAAAGVTFLVTGTYGTASGTGTIDYTDGTTQSFTLTAPDWYATPPADSDQAITTAYRNTPGGGKDQHPVVVYDVSVPLQAGKALESVILPDVSTSPPTAGVTALHVFAIGIG